MNINVSYTEALDMNFKTSYRLLEAKGRMMKSQTKAESKPKPVTKDISWSEAMSIWRNKEVNNATS